MKDEFELAYQDFVDSLLTVERYFSDKEIFEDEVEAELNILYEEFFPRYGHLFQDLILHWEENMDSLGINILVAAIKA